MGYFDLKKQISQKQTTTSKSGYFALKQKVSPVIEANRLRQQEEEKKKKYEELVKNAEIAKQEAEKAVSVWGIAKETAKGVGKTLLDFGKEAVRFPLTAPLKVVQSLTEAATEEPQIYIPETKLEKFIYGDQPRQSYQQDQEAIAKFAKEKGIGKGASVALGTAGASAEILADLALPGMATKIFKSAIGKSILSKMGVKSAKVAEAVSKGTTTEKEIVDIFEQKGLKGVEEVIAEPTVLKPGELAPIVKEIESQTGVKLKPSEALQVKADLEKGISKEAIINDIVEPPKAPKLTPEPVLEEKGIRTPTEEIPVSQPLQEGVEKIPKIETPKIETGKSITAKKMNKSFADDKKMATEYDVIEINKKLDDATKKLQENPEKAISEAFSEGGSNVDRVATLTELFEKSIKDGDEFMQKQAFNKLKQLAPETAQTMNMFKALTEANPHFSYMSSVVDLKLKNLVLSSSNLRKATKGMKPAEALNKAKKMAKEKISKDIINTKSKITIKKAQDLLDSLICK